MGSVAGPSIANMFVMIFEIGWCKIHRPIIYYRFIDDLFVVLSNNQNISDLEMAFGSLKLKSLSGKNVQFLDLDISINSITNNLSFKVFFKPTNTFSYLFIESNHKNSIFKNIVKTVFIRIRRICSKYNDFIYFTSIIKKQLLERGYDFNTINKVFTMVSNLDKEKLLLYKDKKNLDYKNNFIFKTVFDLNLYNQADIIKKSFENLKNDDERFKKFDIIVVNKCQLNLSSLLIHNFKFPRVDKQYFRVCNNSNCFTCKFSNKNYHLNLGENLILPIFDNSSCDSINLVYIIFCNKCNCYYIGQTNNIKKRIYNHLTSIKKFIPFDKKNTVISNHFNLKNHDYSNFSFYIIKKNIEHLNTRLKTESFLINLFIKLNMNILNDYIPFI